MKIQVSIKSVYGNDTIYPLCDKAALFAKLAGTKTLTWASITSIRALGYQVEVVQAVKSL